MTYTSSCACGVCRFGDRGRDSNARTVPRSMTLTKCAPGGPGMRPSASARWTIWLRAPPSIPRSSANHGENNEGHQVEQQDANLEHAHPGVVGQVELLTGQVKPAAMDTPDPVVREHEHDEPQEEHPVVDDRAPEQKDADDVHGHLALLCARARRSWRARQPSHSRLACTPVAWTADASLAWPTSAEGAPRALHRNWGTGHPAPRKHTPHRTCTRRSRGGRPEARREDRHHSTRNPASSAARLSPLRAPQGD